VCLRLHTDFPAAVREMTRVARWFQPNPAAADLYDQYYGSVYRPMYGRLKPLYRQMLRIGGRGR